MEKMIEPTEHPQMIDSSFRTPALNHIQLLTQELDDLYRAMRDERRSIAQWEEDQEVSILGVLELFSGDVQGYAQQLLVGMEPELKSRGEHLRSLNVFSIDYFAAWYFAQWSNYPQVKQYVEQIDHLRLLLIEYAGETPIGVAA
jgi:hypothetical protein